MPVHNTEIADIFDHVADLLEIQDANRFRVRAYRNAARTIRDLNRNLADMLAEGTDLADLPDIGDDLAAKIAEIVNTGHLSLLEDLAKEIPPAIVEVTAVPGIGPKRARALFDALGVSSLDDLREAAASGRIAALPGFGEKTQTRIRDELAKGDVAEKRFGIATAQDFAEPLLAYIRGIDGVTKAVVAGSYRRRKETVGDLDILAVAENGGDAIGRFTEYDEVRQVVSKGQTRSTVVLRSGLQVDLRVVPGVSYGAAMHYFTGSKAHNIACRKRAIARDLKLNEYGVFDGQKRIAGKTEEEVYAAIGLPWIAPELRENRGEIEAAETGKLPALVTRDDIRGDLHAHTTASDGRNTLREMATAAQDLGYEYLGITDHSKSQTVAGGLGRDELLAHLEKIDRLNEELGGFRLLKSSEVDILENGKLDYHDDVLRRLDLVVAAVHSRFDLSEAQQTERIIRAMDNLHVTIIAHPTGRLIGERLAYAVDMEKVITAARERGCFLEINAHPMRLDLNDLHARMARDAGVKLSIGTDSHSTGGLENMRFGIDQARRSWLSAEDVLNTRSWSELSKLIRRG